MELKTRSYPYTIITERYELAHGVVYRRTQTVKHLSPTRNTKSTVSSRVFDLDP